MTASVSQVSSIQSSRLVQASQGYTVRHCLTTNNNGKNSPACAEVHTALPWKSDGQEAGADGHPSSSLLLQASANAGFNWDLGRASSSSAGTGSYEAGTQARILQSLLPL